MKHRSPRSMLAALLVLVACSDAAPTAHEEVAAELRALRLALAEQQRPAPPAAGGAVDAAAALQPLRDGMQALAAAQREQAARQLALAQEMQRWQQVVFAAVGAAKNEEAQSLAQRLQQLEQQLREQDERHREVEALVQRALDQTGERIEEFLQRLQTLPAGGRAVPKPAEPAPTAPGDSTPGAERRTSQARTIAPAQRWWWLLVTGLGAAMAFVFLRRSRREALPPAAPAEPTSADPGAREIWAAAALLGEAVDRLRANDAGRAPAADSTQDLVVVYDGDQPPPPAGPPVETIRCAAAAGEARVLALLAADARVLRRPAPSAHGPANAREIRFHLLPNLPAGERQALLASLRRAAR